MQLSFWQIRLILFLVSILIASVIILALRSSGLLVLESLIGDRQAVGATSAHALVG
jgi:hypothetical protein